MYSFDIYRSRQHMQPPPRVYFGGSVAPPFFTGIFPGGFAPAPSHSSVISCLRLSLQQKLPVLKEIVFFVWKNSCMETTFPIYGTVLWTSKTRDMIIVMSTILPYVWMFMFCPGKLWNFSLKVPLCVCGLCGVWGLWKLFKISLRVSSVVCETLNIFQSSLCEARCWRLWKNCSKKLVLGIFLKPCLNAVKG